ncbi:Nucleoside-diphosphate-sugar epimerase [Arachidicoccus rhizosphaerae]|uniref:Nucleoside-diphosphate-sugar epimerase n=1 Tax=Arachidicoccus rhizosphaerae TaxID=551991 RepID=A0A1H4CNG1_9BACT|nr:NAD-dependent epimerase/dehydratase family protein [Arachidicoccus rhizosphaerae]SEA61985.1 Nucleoside-diphosphate-sugar epimerase [Arachidicoccus rhizosphaerae]
MKIAIIGGSGFVGTRLINELKEHGHSEVINIDKQPSHFYPEITTLANVLDQNKLDELLAGQDLVVLLAAEHRDDVTPKTLYYDVNVQGMRNVLNSMDTNGIKRIIFTSSVAVYGLNKENPSELNPVDPFNEYGKTKYQAEEVLQKWYAKDGSRNVNIVRPTVIFGERNRGNVFNLLRQISSGKFMMVGNGDNKKSMAYIGNIVTFLRFFIEKLSHGYNVFNYVDKPDFTMNELVTHIGTVLERNIPTTKVPYAIGMLGGFGFDFLAKLSGKKFNISSVRVKKFCATTQFDASALMTLGFVPPYTLAEGLANTLRYEFVEKRDSSRDITFTTE